MKGIVFVSMKGNVYICVYVWMCVCNLVVAGGEHEESSEEVASGPDSLELKLDLAGLEKEEQDSSDA